MTGPAVSVILTVFKRTNYLRAAIRSVLQQSFDDFELIVTDDADQEETRLVCQEFREDGRLRYRANQKTLGAPANIAAALREARGRFVCILNDDDLMEPLMLEVLIEPLQKSQAIVMAFGNFLIIDQNGRELAGQMSAVASTRMRARIAPGMIEDSLDFAVRRGVMAVMGALFRREACQPGWLFPEVAGAYDYWLSIKLGFAGPFAYVPQTVMRWRNHGDSASARAYQTMCGPEIHIYEKLLEGDLPSRLRRFVRQELAKCLYWRGGEEMRTRESAGVIRATLWRSFRLRPGGRSLAGWLLTFLPRSGRQIILHVFNKKKRYAERQRAS